MTDSGLRVTPELTIPDDELEESFQTSGGPGGQHANRSATGVTLTWEFVASSVLTDHQVERLREGLGARGESGTLRVVADKSRSQFRNRSLARSRMAELVANALKPPPPPRRATRPSRRAQQRRIDQKRRRGDTKRLRSKPDLD